ncbi:MULTISPECIES: YtnP family quorum-quenching lactonase [Bacillus]|uniref:YtnP family quorum-quenching lactonase n=1 Tax=Bacillus TaxID=1386 RepID=UPI000BB70A70|nr:MULTISPECIES: MBL fold metallo-hydrolase [Bacillus]
METLTLGNWKLTWLNGGVTNLDGGAMFGVVPKPLWSKKYKVNEKNQIELRTDPILLQTGDKNILIESGIGNGKLNDKMKRNFGVTEESRVEEQLEQLGLTPSNIDIILMTHMHFDHACGLTMWDDARKEFVSVFPNATIITSETEWQEMRDPNIRSKNTYWNMNWEAIVDQVQTFTNELEVVEGVKIIHTGGHSDGHSVIYIQNGDERVLHMGDLMPTHAHQQSLWVLAYDDYPMTSIFAKEKWIPFGQQQNVWFTFYHDAQYRAIKWNDAYEITDKVNRQI